MTVCYYCSFFLYRTTLVHVLQGWLTPWQSVLVISSNIDYQVRRVILDLAQLRPRHPGDCLFPYWVAPLSVSTVYLRLLIRISVRLLACANNWFISGNRAQKRGFNGIVLN